MDYLGVSVLIETVLQFFGLNSILEIGFLFFNIYENEFWDFESQYFDIGANKFRNFRKIDFGISTCNQIQTRKQFSAHRTNF